jgi:Ca-activated chloride channel family protein
MRSIHVLAALSALPVMMACGGATRVGAMSPTDSMPPRAYPSMVTATAAPEPMGTESYQDYGINPTTDPNKDRLSTFAVDVDTASYTISRRKLMQENTLPPYAAVRAEEFLNFFRYAYPAPQTGRFAVHLAAAPSPFTSGHHLLRVALQGRQVSAEERRPVHLVYLVDVSGSMMAPDRIEWAKAGLKALTATLKPGDTVGLCTYAGSVRSVVEPTADKASIVRGIDSLSAGGSTAMASGIQLAYDLATKTAKPNSVNRVVVLSDGDANVGNSSPDGVVSLIKQYRGKGITLSTVGFGSGNYKDTMMEKLADAGDGNYVYIDSPDQLRRVFTEQTDSMLQTIARDVKIQVEFDPKAVKEYRLVGYENRDIADKDFRNDKVDAGEIGSGHAVTAMYDVVFTKTDASPIVVRVRSKAPEWQNKSDASEELAFTMSPSAIVPSFEQAPASFRFQTAVVGLAEILRKNPKAAEWKLADVERLAAGSTEGQSDRDEFVQLVRKAAHLSGAVPPAQAVAK